MKRVLIIEDEALVAMHLEMLLDDLACETAATANSLQKALEALDSFQFDFAVLDLNLNGDSSLPIAEALERLGVPFLFATGYGADGLDGCFKNAPVITKPINKDNLAAAIDKLLSG